MPFTVFFCLRPRLLLPTFPLLYAQNPHDGDNDWPGSSGSCPQFGAWYAPYWNLGQRNGICARGDPALSLLDLVPKGSAVAEGDGRGNVCGRPNGYSEHMRSLLQGKLKFARCSLILVSESTLAQVLGHWLGRRHRNGAPKPVSCCRLSLCPLRLLHRNFSIYVCTCAVVVFTMHMFLIRRYLVLSKNWVVSALLALVALTGLVGGVIVTWAVGVKYTDASERPKQRIFTTYVSKPKFK